MDRKKLLSMAILSVLSVSRFACGMTADLTKASMDSVDDMVSYFSGVKMPNRISDTIWNGGQKVATQSMDFIQKSIKSWGGR